MIIVCELQCKGVSHEKVNAGFLHGLMLAYPKDQILFFADKSHFDALKQKVNLNKIYFNSEKTFSLSGIVSYFIVIKNIFDKTLKNGESKIFFLSVNPIILFIVKTLKTFSKYKNICCTFVLHGELEDIANSEYKELYVPKIEIKEGILNILLKHPGVVLLYLKAPFTYISHRYSLIFKNIFRTKKIMIWRHSNQYKYIALSPHVTKNSQKHIDTNYLNFQTIIMPIIFNKPWPIPKNKYIKFAVFGYGDSSQMQKMLAKLSQRKIINNYEIKTISMDSRGTEGCKHVTRISNGKVLTREEMENAAKDVDVFINLYDKSRHKLGCSLSIFESFSYLKPILHLSNDGYDYFNNPKKPIGYKTQNLDEFVDKMVDMIENYEKYKRDLVQFRKNMLEYRQQYLIDNNLDKLKLSFEF